MQVHSSTGGVSLPAFLEELVQSNLTPVLAAAPAAAPEPVKLAGGTEALIMACSDAVRGLAWRFAKSDSRIDADEMYSIGMLEACEAVAAGRLARASNPVAYLIGAARFAMIAEWRRVHDCSIASLDAPLSDDDSTLTLYDVLPAPVSAPAPAPSRRSQALNGAMRRLAARQRAALRRRYGLPGYGAHSIKEAAVSLRATPQAVKMAAWHGLRKLARDTRLSQVVKGVRA